MEFAGDSTDLNNLTSLHCQYIVMDPTSHQIAPRKRARCHCNAVPQAATSADHGSSEEKPGESAWECAGSHGIPMDRDIAQSVSCLTFLSYVLSYVLSFLMIVSGMIHTFRSDIAISTWHIMAFKNVQKHQVMCLLRVPSWTKQIARSKRLPSAPRDDKWGHHDEWYYSAKPFWRNWTTTLQELGHTNLDHHDRTRCIQNIYT